MKRISSAGFFSVVFFAAIATAHALNIREGNWSMTTIVHSADMDNQMAEAQKDMDKMSPEEKAMMEGMMGKMGMKMGGQGSAGMGMSSTRTQCITQDTPVPKCQEEDCQETHTINGNTINFEVTCPDGHSTGQVTYNNNSMNGTIQSTTTKYGKEEHVTIDVKGNYIGPCEAPSALIREAN